MIQIVALAAGLFVNLATLLFFVFGMRFKLNAVAEAQAKIISVLYGQNGKMNLQTVSDCESCRKSCRDEICEFIGRELSENKRTIDRIHSRIDSINDEIRTISCWMPDRNK